MHKLTLILALACLVCQAAAADTNGRLGAQTSFDIPSQPLGTALKQLADQAGIQILFEEKVVQGHNAPAVKSRESALQALSRLLSNTDLEFTAKDETVAVRRKSSPPVSSDSRQPAAPAAEAFPLRLAASDAPAANARDAQSVNEKNSKESADVDEILVRGAKETGIANQGVIPREPNQALRYQVWDREAIEHSGATSLPEFFRQVTAATNAGTTSQATFGMAANILGGISEVTDNIDLRGFGSAQTLIMLNGRRLYGSETSGPDLNRIPIGAIERIELLPTSGSAIYGSQAVGGVVNIVLRKGYKGTELTSTFGASTGGGAAEYKLDLYHAQTLSEGSSVTFTLSYDHRDALHANERGYYQQALDKYDPSFPDYTSFATNFTGTRAFVSNLFGTSLGIPGSTASYASVPAGSNGILTPASFAATAGAPALSPDRPSQRVLLPPNEGFSIYSTIEHPIRGEQLGFYADLNLGYSTRAVDYPGFNPTVLLGPTNPLNPFRTGVTTGFVGKQLQVAFDPADLPPDRLQAKSRTLRAVAGLKGGFAEQRWKWAVDFSWSREQSDASNVSWQPLLSAAVNAQLYNPLRDFANVEPASASLLSSLYSRHDLKTVPTISALNWRLNGETFRTWGGTAKLSIGSEIRLEEYFNDSQWAYGGFASLPGAQLQTPDQTNTTRRANAAYAEIVLPLVGERNRRPFLYTLDLSGAARYEKYDDFGSASPPMLALKYAPAQDIAFRGSFSEGFQPPTQNDLYQAPLLSVSPVGLARFIFTDRERQGFTPLYQAGTTFTTQYQGNENLRAETSENIDAGIILTPRWLPNFSLNVSYFRYDKRDVVTFLDGQQLFDNYPQLFIRGPNLPTDPAGVPGPVVRYINMPINVAKLVVEGWDVDASYRWATERFGTFTFSLNGTHNIHFREQVLPGEPIIEIVGEVDILPSLSAPLEWRGNAGLGWDANRWSAGLLAHYTHSYHTNETTPTEGNPFATGIDGAAIDSATTYNVRLSYALDGRGSAGSWQNRLLEGTKISLSAINVFDSRPPYTSNAIHSWYSFYQDPRQRFITLQMRKNF